MFMNLNFRRRADHGPMTIISVRLSLQYLGLIVPISNASKDLKEYQMHKLLVQNHQIDRTVSLYKNLPTQISQWAKVSQI